MSKYYYKSNKRLFRKLSKILSISLFAFGLLIIGYVFLPFISWQVYFSPVFASQNVEVPIPKTTIVENNNIVDLLSNAASSVTVDYTNANNWYPAFRGGGGNIVSQYLISIPKISVNNAIVSTGDPDLSKHLVQYNTDSIPPLKGNTVIFGHSTLPQLYEPNNYKTIFANAYKLEVGDELVVNVKDIIYKYKIFNVTVVDPTDTSVLSQNQNDSYITIITCTPPGTTWKRLILKARIESLENG